MYEREDRSDRIYGAGSRLEKSAVRKGPGPQYQPGRPVDNDTSNGTKFFYDKEDRYGFPNGTYTSPVKNGIPYDYVERSLPYVEDKSLYHQYIVKGDFTNIKYYIDNCKNQELKAQVEASILKYHGGNYDGLKTYIGDIAPGFGTVKGGTQVQLPLTVEQLKGLGLIEELE